MTWKWILVGLGATAAFACSATNDSVLDDPEPISPGQGGATTSSGVGGINLGVGGSGGGTFVGDPITCEQAASSRSYIGCDFYPTVTPNNVWSIFDYAVVVANTGENMVTAEVTRGGNVVASATIAPNSLQTIYLPWVSALKGPDADAVGSATPVTSSDLVEGGAYHLTTDFPVTVYQFNALEYAGVGGPPGKNWSNCPGNFSGIGCFSFSNDASLLIPSTAWTSTYRLTGIEGWELADIGPYAVVTAASDGTSVTTQLSSIASVNGGGGISGASPGGTVTFTLNRGDAALLVAPSTSDLSGSLLTASHPVQVVMGIPCTNIPSDASACDHLEETVFPAETLGSRYVVARPTGPLGNTPGHRVKLYGNFDGTTLSYPGGSPPGAPTSLDAGQVVDLGIVSQDFEVEGTEAFAVATFQLGGSVVDPNAPVGEQKGDPAFSLATGVAQYRDKYVFLAPTDYDTNYVDVIVPDGVTFSIDGTQFSGTLTPIGSDFAVARVLLDNGTGGQHVLEATAPVGIQVAGYGSYTSYYYPGGLNLNQISAPPPR